MAQVRCLVDSWNRARSGEGWWATTRESEMDRAWAVVKRYAIEQGGDPAGSMARSGPSRTS
jgi:hypothetical protein